MPTFHEVQFPPKIAYGASGGPMFNTSIVTTFGGFEQRNVNWQKARGRWDDVGPQSDIYSVGATLFTLLTGELTHVANTATNATSTKVRTKRLAVVPRVNA